ncbi:hypothetical protein PV689_03285 [Streptomyces sp. ATCC51928]|uniref:Uncharacterized protein n=1 Tax=Streptomyces caviscabies TaxID=90079 RepID=A0ABW2MP85_9ACTN|nr:MULTISPECIES: hypothetical protein [unclassified Streptomyces]MDX3500934.1 hypothetical protein [Streptomyces sp. ATCC51928]MDX5520995.1 hypothetical protein [Streptomyces sp. DE06-01C]
MTILSCSAEPATLSHAGMGWLRRRRDEYEQRQLAQARQAAAQVAARVARQRQLDQLVAEGAERARRAKYDAITEEVDRRQAAGQLSPLQAAKVIRGAVARAGEDPGLLDHRHSQVMPAAVRQLVTNVISGIGGIARVDMPRTPPDRVVSPEGRRAEQRKARERARARDKAWAKEEARRADEEREREEEDERRHQEWHQELVDRLQNPEKYPRRRSRTEADEEAPGLLASAGLPAGRNELRIAARLLMRHEQVTPEQMRRAFAAFEEIYEDQVRRYKESGGRAAWPSAASLIERLF